MSLGMLVEPQIRITTVVPTKQIFVMREYFVSNCNVQMKRNNV